MFVSLLIVLFAACANLVLAGKSDQDVAQGAIDQLKEKLEDEGQPESYTYTIMDPMTDVKERGKDHIQFMGQTPDKDYNSPEMRNLFVVIIVRLDDGTYMSGAVTAIYQKFDALKKCVLNKLAVKPNVYSKQKYTIHPDSAKMVRDDNFDKAVTAGLDYFGSNVAFLASSVISVQRNKMKLVVGDAVHRVKFDTLPGDYIQLTLNVLQSA